MTKRVLNVDSVTNGYNDFYIVPLDVLLNTIIPLISWIDIVCLSFVDKFFYNQLRLSIGTIFQNKDNEIKLNTSISSHVQINNRLKDFCMEFVEYYYDYEITRKNTKNIGLVTPELFHKALISYEAKNNNIHNQFLWFLNNIYQNLTLNIDLFLKLFDKYHFDFDFEKHKFIPIFSCSEFLSFVKILRKSKLYLKTVLFPTKLSYEDNDKLSAILWHLIYYHDFHHTILKKFIYVNQTRSSPNAMARIISVLIEKLNTKIFPYLPFLIRHFDDTTILSCFTQKIQLPSKYLATLMRIAINKNYPKYTSIFLLHGYPNFRFTWTSILLQKVSGENNYHNTLAHLELIWNYGDFDTLKTITQKFLATDFIEKIFYNNELTKNKELIYLEENYSDYENGCQSSNNLLFDCRKSGLQTTTRDLDLLPVEKSNKKGISMECLLVFAYHNSISFTWSYLIPWLSIIEFIINHMTQKELISNFNLFLNFLSKLFVKQYHYTSHTKNMEQKYYYVITKIMNFVAKRGFEFPVRNTDFFLGFDNTWDFKDNDNKYIYLFKSNIILLKILIDCGFRFSFDDKKAIEKIITEHKDNLKFMLKQINWRVLDNVLLPTLFQQMIISPKNTTFKLEDKNYVYDDYRNLF